MCRNFCWVSAATMILLVGCGTSNSSKERFFDSGVEPMVSDEIDSEPKRYVVVQDVDLSSKTAQVLEAEGFDKTENCIVLSGQFDELGHTRYVLEIFSIPCGKKTNAVVLDKETRKASVRVFRHKGKIITSSDDPNELNVHGLWVSQDDEAIRSIQVPSGKREKIAEGANQISFNFGFVAYTIEKGKITAFKIKE